MLQSFLLDSLMHVSTFNTLQHIFIFGTPTRAKYLSLVIFHVPIRARLLVSISEGKGFIAPFSKHCSEWSRMDVPSVLKCKYWGSSPAQRALAKANAKTPQSFELFCLSTATNSKLIRRSVGIRIEQICCFVLRGIAVFMLSYTLTTG